MFRVNWQVYLTTKNYVHTEMTPQEKSTLSTYSYRYSSVKKIILPRHLLIGLFIGQYQLLSIVLLPRQGGDLPPICLVFLSVSNFTWKLLSESLWKLYKEELIKFWKSSSQFLLSSFSVFVRTDTYALQTHRRRRRQYLLHPCTWRTGKYQIA